MLSKDYPAYRLMCLYPRGVAAEYARGSTAYLFRMAAQRRVKGRSWIEMTVEPATRDHVVGNRWTFCRWPRQLAVR